MVVVCGMQTALLCIVCWFEQGLDDTSLSDESLVVVVVVWIARGESDL